MSYKKVLQNEIAVVIDNLIEENKIINPKAVSKVICTSHTDELKGLAPFSTHNNYSNVRREVRNFISKKLDISKEIESRQLTLDGSMHIQKYYTLKRGGEYIGAPIEEMTISEILAKADYYDKMGDACKEHAKELRDFAKGIQGTLKRTS